MASCTDEQCADEKSGEEKKWCVYLHTFPKEITGYDHDKYYVGITSQRLERRWRNNGAGYQCLKPNGEYRQPLIARATLKYDWNDIQHEVIASNLTMEEAEQMEIDLVAKYRSNEKEYGYNIENGGHAHKVSDETKKRLSELAKKRFEQPEWREYIKQLNVGRKLTDEHKRKIGEGCKGKCAGEKHPMYGKHPSEETIKKRIEKQRKPVLCVETGIVYKSAKEVKEKTGIDSSCITKCCKGKRQTAGGYHWKYYINETVEEPEINDGSFFIG